MASDIFTPSSEMKKMNYPTASSGVSKTTTGKILRPKGRGIHPDGNNVQKVRHELKNRFK
jgi:hypothetical protein